MIVTCPGCASKYRVRNEVVPPEGARMRCPKCETLFLAKPPVDADAPPPAPPPAQRPLSSFQQVAPSALQQLPTGPQMDLPKTGLAHIPSGFVVPGAQSAAMLQAMQAPTVTAPIPMPTAAPSLGGVPMPSGSPLDAAVSAPGPITGLFNLPQQLQGPPVQKPMQVFSPGGPPPQPAQPQRDLLEELGLAPAKPAPSPILPDDGFFDAVLKGGAPGAAPKTPPPLPARAATSSVELDMPSDPSTPSLVSGPSAAASSSSTPAPASSSASSPRPRAAAPAAPAGGTARVSSSFVAQAASWLVLVVGLAGGAAGGAFAAWTAGAADLDATLMPVAENVFGATPPYSYAGKDAEPLDALVKRAQAARQRGDFVDEAVAWQRVLKRDPSYGGAGEALRAAQKALGVVGGAT